MLGYRELEHTYMYTHVEYMCPPTPNKTKKRKNKKKQTKYMCPPTPLAGHMI